MSSDARALGIRAEMNSRRCWEAELESGSGNEPREPTKLEGREQNSDQDDATFNKLIDSMVAINKPEPLLASDLWHRGRGAYFLGNVAVFQYNKGALMQTMQSLSEVEKLAY